MGHRLYMWIGVGVALIGTVVFGTITLGLHEDIEGLEENAVNLLAEKEKVEKRLASSLVEFDEDEYKQEIEVKTVNAKDIGNRIVEIQNELADMFRVDGDPSKDFIDHRLKRGPELGEELATLSDIDPSFYYNSWKLNKGWDLALDTVISYRNVDSFPVIFSMTTTKGEPAGLIKATYNVSEDKMQDIERHYTALGEQEAVQGVGD